RILDRQELLLRTSAIVAGETKKTREAVERLTAFDLLKKYRAFFDHLVQTASEPMRAEAEQLRAFTLETLDAKQLYYEDQIALLYLKSVWGGVPKAAGVRFVIIDEAQDYTPLQYEIFRLLFGQASLTILGDENQAIHPYMNVGSYETIAQVFPKESTLFLKLSKSYRSTYEISAFAAKLLGQDAAQSIARHGEEPIMNGFSNLSELQNTLMNDAAALTEQGHSSVGILTRTKREAVELSMALRRKLRHKTILSGDEGYARGVIVMPAYLAKGLEFDAVLIYNASAKSYAYEDERLYLYTACTRALHVLRVYYVGQPSALLAGAK
ncbi:MAG TPA: UvrD-helicase domain-containing protein, partial [Clostridia bacterium]|nr:UvrD-helicase domain-containing protein [Clostridia bacterium]